MNDEAQYPFQSEIRQSFRTVARKLKVDEATIRHRIKKLHESGVMKGMHIIANPELFYLRMAHARGVIAPQMKDDAIRKIKLMDGVLEIVNHLGDSMRVILYFQDEATLKKQIELITRMSNFDDLIHREIHFPLSALTLCEEDLELVASIQSDPTKPYDLIARETGMSNKTVKRKLEKMMAERPYS